MAYQRVTLTQLKARLRERQGEFDNFWPEPELEAALNETIAVWQLLTGDYPEKDVMTFAVAPTGTFQTPTFTIPMATVLRVRCTPTASPTPDAYGKALKSRSIFDLDKTEYKWRTTTVADCPDFWSPLGLDTIGLYPLPTIPMKLEILYINAEPRMTANTDYVQVGDEELIRLIDYAQWVLSFKEGVKEAIENLEPFRTLFLMAAGKRNARLRSSALYRVFLGDLKDDASPASEALMQKGVRG